MNKQIVNIEVTVYESLAYLPTEDQILMEKAVIARKMAYAPYSNFYVGVSILLANGEMVCGNNQENAAFPSGLCAERVALFYAASKYPNEQIRKIAISATSRNKIVTVPVAPCGNCRQALAEYENKQRSPMEVIFMGEVGEVNKSDSISNLLPFAFDGSLL